jgi:hypothetical protein
MGVSSERFIRLSQALKSIAKLRSRRNKAAGGPWDIAIALLHQLITLPTSLDKPSVLL